MSPPCGFGSKLPVARRDASQRITEDTDTPNRLAAARRLDPASTAASARDRISMDSGLPISLPPDLLLEQRIRTPAPWESGGFCEARHDVGGERAATRRLMEAGLNETAGPGAMGEVARSVGRGLGLGGRVGVPRRVPSRLLSRQCRSGPRSAAAPRLCESRGVGMTRPPERRGAWIAGRWRRSWWPALAGRCGRVRRSSLHRDGVRGAHGAVSCGSGRGSRSMDRRRPG